MDEIDRFKQRLIEKNNSPEDVLKAINVLKSFQEFLEKREKNLSDFTSEDFYEYSAFLIDNNKNDSFTYEVFIIFGQFVENFTLVKLGREVFDGGEVIENFSKRLTEEYGEEFRNKIFGKLEIPPLGINPKLKPDYTKKLIGKYVEEVGEEESEKFLAKGLRDPYYEWRKPDRERFLNSKNIDEFRKEKRKRFIESLEKHRDEGTLFFTQEVNDEVVKLVKNDSRIEGGEREGNILHVTKIPHETIKFLKAEDQKMKAYYYCHCPWAKEAIKDGTSDQIPAVFCNCSGGYYKNYWEIVLDQPIEVKTVQTVIKGDPVCQFDVYLPEEIVKDLE